MTTKELINQYVTAHADNRWMDASELEALLTEFAEKLKEPTSKDLEQAAQEYTEKGSKCQDEMDAFIAGAQWQKEQMMKGAIDTRIDKRLADMIGYTGSERVKVIIIKE